jgi:hypothetical protein
MLRFILTFLFVGSIYAGHAVAADMTINGRSNGYTAAPGETLTISVFNGPGDATDWADITNQGSENALEWVYIDTGTQDRPPRGPGPTSATFTLPAPTIPGNYLVRLYGDDGCCFAWLSANVSLTIQVGNAENGPVGGVTLVRTANSHGSGDMTGGSQICAWNFGSFAGDLGGYNVAAGPVGYGNTVVGYIHAANSADNVPLWPRAVYDNAGNLYNLSSYAVWDPFGEAIGSFSLTNVQGNPTIIYFDFSNYPAGPLQNVGDTPGNTQIGNFCDVGLAEYYGASQVVVTDPYLSYSLTPTATVTNTSNALVWGEASNFECDTAGDNPPCTYQSRGPAGYNILIDDYPGDDMGIWGSNSIVSPGTQTLTWSNPQADPSIGCHGLAGYTNGCPAVVQAIAVQ